MSKLEILRSILDGRFDLIKTFDMNQPASYQDEIIITPRKLRHVLDLYLSGIISSIQLQEWSEFICLRPEYVVPGGNNDTVNDYYESMYYVIQKLSTPCLDGKITFELVQKYKNEFVSLKEPEDLE